MGIRVYSFSKGGPGPKGINTVGVRMWLWVSSFECMRCNWSSGFGVWAGKEIWAQKQVFKNEGGGRDRSISSGRRHYAGIECEASTPSALERQQVSKVTPKGTMDSHMDKNMWNMEWKLG